MNDGAPIPSDPGKRYYRVIAPKGRTPLVAVLLGDTFRGFWTHWIQNDYTPRGKVVPCFGDPSTCFGCRQALGLRWTGYIAAQPLHLPDRHVLALTELAARSLLDVKRRRGTLRGTVVDLRRKLGHVNAPVELTVKGVRSEAETPETFEIMDSLNRMWCLKPGFVHRGINGSKDDARINRDPSTPEALRRDVPEVESDERDW